jgi:circadian clock protein KaiC
MVNQDKPDIPGPTAKNATGIQKIATQIEGLDDILDGGLPRGRVTLVGGGPGTGKTVLGLEFLYRGARSGQPGIFVSFEESAQNIRHNALSLGWDLPTLEKAGKLVLMEMALQPEMTVSGEFNLGGLLAIIAGKAKDMGAGRIVIDALDVLLRFFDNPQREEQQIVLLHQWLQQQGLTAILTTKNPKTSDGPSACDNLDFMADCVIYLDQRIQDQVNTKRMRVVKYRGSGYGSNEYPFLIGGSGMFFNAVTDMWLHYDPPCQRVSSGIQSLDEILGGGHQRGSSVLISGATGTGKTALASTFARDACQRGQKVLYVNFEEPVDGMVAGMRSLGIDLKPPIEDCLLWVMSVMPESRGVEEHLYDLTTAIRSFRPDHVMIDAISACKRIAGEKASSDFIIRMVHFCKRRGITLISNNQAKNSRKSHEISGIGISSIIDAIITLQYKDVGNQTTRVLHVIKSRGSKHSNRYHTYSLTDDGIQFNPATST